VRAGAALEGVVLGDAVEPVGSAAACGSADSRGAGDVDAGCVGEGRCCQQGGGRGGAHGSGRRRTERSKRLEKKAGVASLVRREWAHARSGGGFEKARKRAEVSCCAMCFLFSILISALVFAVPASISPGNTAQATSPHTGALF
jgi:hypothetical protein